MTDRLAIPTFFTQAEQLSDEILEGFYDPMKDRDLVVIPDVRLADLERYSHAPSDLADEGYDVPDDADEALEYAIDQFRCSEHYYDWENGFRPNKENYWLWPCEPRIADHDLANRIHELGLNCCYVNGELLGRNFQGFILTGGGMNLSDDLCMAYITAGCVPPRDLLQDAARNTSDDDWREMLLDAMERAAEFMVGEAESYRETIEIYRGRAPSLT
jgi:hypothetical protein